MLVLAVAILTVLVVLLVTYIFFMKATLKSIIRQLRADFFERQVNIALLDNDIIELTKTINEGISYYQSKMIEVKRKEQILKDSILNISHDLRTPLTSIIGYLQILSTLKQDKEQSEILDIVFMRTEELKQLTANFYELSLIEIAGETPAFECIDIIKILPGYLLEFTEEFEKKKMIPRIVTESTKAEVYVDSFLMKRVINNLISNALKYGEDYLNIYIDTKNTVKITFENKMMKDSFNILNVFERFYAGDSNSNGGTGLGLYIVKEFVHKMNGKIEAYKRGPAFNIQMEFEQKK